MGLSLNVNNGHILTKCLLQNREVRLVVSAPCCKRGVKDLVVLLSEVCAEEVDDLGAGVLAKYLIGDGEALSGGDSGLHLQLNVNFLLSCRKFHCQLFGISIIVFPGDSGESGDWCVGGYHFSS